MNRKEFEEYKIAVEILIESNRLLTEKLNVAIDFLDRLSQWDMIWSGEGQPNLVSDGYYWKKEIDETLEKLNEIK